MPGLCWVSPAATRWVDPSSFCKRDVIAARFPTGVTEFIGGGWLDLDPGEVTDDTQQALILAESLTASGLDLDRFAAGLIAWFRSNPKDIGNTTRIALEALAAGTAPLEAGAVALAARGERAAAANGAVMRCAPVALRFRREPDRLVRASLDSARVTHAEARAVVGNGRGQPGHRSSAGWRRDRRRTGRRRGGNPER